MFSLCKQCDVFLSVNCAMGKNSFQMQGEILLCMQYFAVQQG